MNSHCPVANSKRDVNKWLMVESGVALEVLGTVVELVFFFWWWWLR